MPGCAVHYLLALQVADRWTLRPEAAPVSLAVPAARNAFLAGALAPDMGYFPGGEPLLTDLCHYVCSAGLVRVLVRTARSDVERAYAWGWATHVLADVLGHPIVNRAAAELKLGDRGHSLSYHDDPVAHVRVEMGLDAVWAAAQDRTAAIRLEPVFDAAGIGYVAAAYRETYGIVLDSSAVQRSHLATVRFGNQLHGYLRLRGARFLGRWGGVAGLVVNGLVAPVGRLYTSLLQRDTFLYGLTHLVPPQPWFRDAISGVISEFADRFQQHAALGLGGLDDFNLDLGVVEGETPSYPLAVATLERLRRLRDVAPAAPQPST
jgi:hypothetical protein